MISTIKCRRAAAASAIGAHPRSAAAMLGYIPPDVARALTGAQIGRMMDALWRACQDAKRIAARAAIDDRVIWDGRGNVLAELTPFAEQQAARRGIA